MEFHFVRNRLNKGLVSVVDRTGKSRYICFKNKQTAVSCVKHMCNFRSTYGRWPLIDLSNPSTKIRSDPFGKKRTPEELEKFLSVETIGEEELTYLGLSSNTSFLYCHTFGVIPDGRDFMTVSLSCQEIDTDSDTDFFAEHLSKHWDRGSPPFYT